MHVKMCGVPEHLPLVRPPPSLLMTKEHLQRSPHAPQEAAPRETVDTESVGRQADPPTGEASRLWFALVCEKSVHLDSWQTF